MKGNTTLILLGIIILILNSCMPKKFGYKTPFKESLLKANDTIEGFFLLEQHLTAYTSHDIIVQSSGLVPVNKNNEIEDYGIVYSFDFINRSKFYHGTNLDSGYFENGSNMAFEFFDYSTTIQPFCGTSYRLCKVKMIINKGVFKKRESHYYWTVIDIMIC